MKKILFIALLLYCKISHAQYTPNCSDLSLYASYPTPLTAAEVSYINSVQQSQYPNAVKLEDPSSAYNCHNYAWVKRDGGNAFWLNTPGDDVFWNDGSYIVSSTTSALETRVSYQGDHSAVITGANNECTSKWGQMGLYKHDINYVPASYLPGQTKGFYKRNLPEITGSSSFCSSASYALSSVPAGATVSWSANPSEQVSISTTNNVATITKIGNGSFQLSATVSNSCGNFIVPAKTVFVGTPVPGDFPISGQTSICANSVTTYSVNALPGATNYNWIIPPAALTNGWYIIAGQGTPVLTVNTGLTSTSIRLKVSNNCGEGTSPEILFVNVNCGGFKFAVSPNPASNTIKISQNESVVQKQASNETVSQNASLSPFNVKIFDHNARFLKSGLSKSGENIELVTSDIPNGTYFLHIFQGKDVVKKQIIINH
ncbi:T9SS type A sorting domain-containing protein [Pedobacter sp. ISL-68]|uniref:T9SS type A sorting domain-containing protein n=1 Tax=unclassified Pedobacter TaxID=2628915 RepID=UPI001BEA5940|nr:MULTISPECIES: T9SS type A sorting domain-containing protein [unclassified Pedobacter]MBT2562996.1 T9SS type A sorting domain-containing protein [Pedobacter sp. ISL-64]MBT2593000.1 T9SS type A sorting domain-containing protein [Pedobacter sp. ISL-68]